METKMKLKAMKGMTLIALMITIIILIILASISIELLLGENGILNQALKARTKYEEATYNEKIEFARVNVLLDVHREISIDEWIEQIYKEKIVPKDSIIKTSEHSAKIITPEGYIIYIQDGIEDEDVDTDKPVIVLGETKIILENVEIPILGNIQTDLELPENQYGKNYAKGLIFKYQDEYYIVKYNQYLTKDNYDQMIQSRNGFIKLNPEKGLVTPNESTVEGDFKFQDGKVYVYAPYGENATGYAYDDWWIEVINP